MPFAYLYLLLYFLKKYKTLYINKILILLKTYNLIKIIKNKQLKHYKIIYILIMGCNMGHLLRLIN